MTSLARQAFPKRGAMIFYAHRLAGDSLAFFPGIGSANFDEQIAYLTRHYEVIALSRLLEYYEAGRRVPDNSVVITFDDGFRDNLEIGLPVLEKHGVTATIFVITGAMSSGELPWPQRLGYILQQTSYADATFSGVDYPLGTEMSRRVALRAIRKRLLELPSSERDERIAELARHLQVDPPRNLMLSWADLADLKGHGIEIGAHTHSHPWLGFISRQDAVWELGRSRQELRERLGITRSSFCFPAGSCNADLVDVVRSMGFRSSFLPNAPHRVNTLDNADAYSLGRIGLPIGPAYLLEAEVDGPFHPARRLLRWFARKNGEIGNDRRWLEQ